MAFPVMPLVERIRLHPLYRRHFDRISALERNRAFCRHGIGHLLDTARIAYILNLERSLGFRKETVYAAALLHDIGKDEQYERAVPHEIAGAEIARRILDDVDELEPTDKEAIVAAVQEHRRYSDEASALGKLLFEADKASRACYACDMREACSWSPEKMNKGVGV